MQSMKHGTQKVASPRHGLRTSGNALPCNAETAHHTAPSCIVLCDMYGNLQHFHCFRTTKFNAGHLECGGLEGAAIGEGEAPGSVGALVLKRLRFAHDLSLQAFIS